MQLTDGKKVVELTKEDMELLLDGIREIKFRYRDDDGECDNLLDKLEGLDY